MFIITVIFDVTNNYRLGAKCPLKTYSNEKGLKDLLSTSNALHRIKLPSIFLTFQQEKTTGKRKVNPFTAYFFLLYFTKPPSLPYLT